MKKLLAIIVSVFISLFNNISYTAVVDKQYTDNNYYKVDVSDAPDYREYYSSVPSTAKKYACKTANYNAQGRKVKMTTNVAYTGYWFENAVNMDEASLSNTSNSYTFASSGYIIIPFDGKLNTDSTTNNGENMTVICSVDGKDYQLTFTGMECWYCDVGRGDSGESSKYHTSDNQKGKSFKAGNVLGRSIGGKTVVEIKPIKKGKVKGSCTLQQFYKLTFTEG